MIHPIVKYLLGLFIISIGINLSILADLGVSAVNCVPYSISIVSKIPLGICVISVYSFYVFLQYLLLKKDFHWTQLMQLVCVTIFGQFVALTEHLMNFYVVGDSIIIKLILLVFSIFFTSLGVSTYMQTGLTVLPAEGLALALAKKIPKYPFSVIKTSMDTSFVISALCVGLFFEGRVIGVGMGTVISALLTGKAIGFFNNYTKLL